MCPCNQYVLGILQSSIHSMFFWKWHLPCQYWHSLLGNTTKEFRRYWGKEKLRHQPKRLSVSKYSLCFYLFSSDNSWTLSAERHSQLFIYLLTFISIKHVTTTQASGWIHIQKKSNIWIVIHNMLPTTLEKIKSWR